MRAHSPRGFTLIELMVVVIIIGVFAGLAAAQLSSVRHRNTLTSLVNQVQQLGTRARTVAIQTRRAAVLEVRPQGLWLNVLDGPNCWNAPAQTCAYDLFVPIPSNGFTAALNLELGTTDLAEARVVMCGGSFRSAGAPAGTALLAAGYALCYSGAGELWIRNNVNNATVCCTAPCGAAGVFADWTQASGANVTATPAVLGGTVQLADGAVLMFNRLEGAVCGGAVLDVRQAVFFSTSGAPFTRTAPR